MSTLNPYPFCGNEASGPEKISKDGQNPKWEICCAGFCVSMVRSRKAEVVSDWNQRVKDGE